MRYLRILSLVEGERSLMNSSNVPRTHNVGLEKHPTEPEVPESRYSRNYLLDVFSTHIKVCIVTHYSLLYHHVNFREILGLPNVLGKFFPIAPSSWSAQVAKLSESHNTPLRVVGNGHHYNTGEAETQSGS